MVVRDGGLAGVVDEVAPEPVGGGLLVAWKFASQEPVGIAGDSGLDDCRLAEIALGDDPGLAVYTGGLGQVVVGVPTDLLVDNRSHALGNTRSSDKSRPFDQGTHALFSALFGRNFRTAQQ